MRPGLGAPRVVRGNTAMMAHARPAYGTFFLNDDTGHVHQWNGQEWESAGGNGTPEKADILKLLQKQAQDRQAAGVAVGSGSGSTPGIRRPGVDPSVTDPTLYTAPPAPTGLPRFGGIDVPILSGRGGGQRGGSGYGDSSGAAGGMSTGAAGIGSQVFDTFERVRATDWGPVTPSGLFTWVQTLGGAQKAASVAGGAGLMSVGGAGGSGFVNEKINSASAPWNVAGGFDLRLLFQIDAIPGVGKDDLLDLFFSQNGGAPFNTLDLHVSSNALRGKVVVASGANTQTVVKTDWTANATWNVRWEHRPGTVSRAKVWPFPSGEPLAWLISVVGVAGTDNQLEVEHDNNGGGIATAIVLRIFDMQFA